MKNCFDKCLDAWSFHEAASYPGDWAWIVSIFKLASAACEGPDEFESPPREALRRLKAAGVDWKVLEKIKAELHSIENKLALGAA